MKTAIGVFDSGVGGLTVLKSLRTEFPKQEFIYLGDTARLPYGAKSGETIRQYSLQNIRYLASLNVQAVVVACNSASTQVTESELEGLPIYNVIDPGVTAALAVTQNNSIGLLGTRATVESHVYQTRLKKQAALLGKDDLRIFAQACPLFVPLAEEGWTGDPITNLIVYRYLHPLLHEEVDTMILGCTHYPILRNSIERAAGKAVNLVDSGKALANLMKQDFANGRLKPSASPSLRVLMTDLSSHLQKWAFEILEETSRPIEVVNTT
ncbi:MAG: glutamate racemase [Bdellovibrio sp.]